MPYVALEDVGTTRRGFLSGRRRLQAWERTGGTCVVCGQRIDGVRERWIVEHIRALELGGADSLENMGPAHEACGREKTRDDHSRAAQAKRQKLRHLGAAVTLRPLSGSRGSILKRKVDGTVVLREPPRHSRSDVAHGPAQDHLGSSTSRPLTVDSASACNDQLCANSRTHVKIEDGGMADQMEIRTGKAKPSRNGAADKDAIPPGEILPSIADNLDFIFDERSLLPGESTEQYEVLLESIVQQAKPADVIEAIWVKDIIDLIWEAKRYRRWRRQILIQARLKAAEEMLQPTSDNASSLRSNHPITHSGAAIAAAWAIDSPRGKDWFEPLLMKRGLTAEDVMAQGFQLSLPVIERIDRLIASADQRRDALLREIERKQANFAQQVRKATTEILDVSPDGT